MKFMVKICLLVALFTGLAFSQSNILSQYVYVWPDYVNALPTVHWMCYNLYQASTHWADESHPSNWTTDYAASYDIIWWNNELAAFNGGINPWVAGDTVVCFGSFDSAYAADPDGYDDNPDHAGYYWVFQDTIISATEQWWTPSDTLRIMPKATVSQEFTPAFGPDTTWDSVIVQIKNPAQTESNIGGYSVAGYYIILNAEPDPTPAAGTPASYNYDLGYFPIAGGPGDYTFCKYWPGDFLATGGKWNTYHAYYLVFEPDDPGYGSYYMSQNSNGFAIVGIEESKADPKPTRLSLFAAPSITKNRTTITYALPKATRVNLVIYNTVGQVIRTLCDEVMSAGEHTVVFDGHDLPSGIYFCALRTPDQLLREKLTLLR